jgi:hypothetical protein
MISITFLFAPVTKSSSLRRWPKPAATLKAPATVHGRYICLRCDLSTAFEKRFVLTAQKRQPEGRRYVFGASLAGGAAAGAAGAGAAGVAGA